jgi:hypothetical protein
VALGKWKILSVRLETVLISVQRKCMVWDKRSIGSEIILALPMELPGDVGQMEPRFGLFGDSVNRDVRYVHGLGRTCSRFKNHFGHTRWNS